MGGGVYLLFTENGDYVISAVDTEKTTTANQEVGLSGSVTIDITSVTEMKLRWLRNTSLVTNIDFATDTGSPDSVTGFTNVSVFDTKDITVDGVVISNIPIVRYTSESDSISSISSINYMELDTTAFEGEGTYYLTNLPIYVIPTSISGIRVINTNTPILMHLVIRVENNVVSSVRCLADNANRRLWRKNNTIPTYSGIYFATEVQRNEIT